MATVANVPGVNPNETFAGQLRMLHGMGFTDLDKSRLGALALKRSNGRIQEAIDMLVNDNIPEETPDDAYLSSLPLSTRTREGLRELKSMGFTNVHANLEALRQARDDVEKAYVILMEAENGPVKKKAAEPVAVPKKGKKSKDQPIKSVSPVAEPTLADVLGQAPKWGESGSKGTSSGYLGVSDDRYGGRSPTTSAAKLARSVSPNFRPSTPNYNPSANSSSSSLRSSVVSTNPRTSSLADSIKPTSSSSAFSLLSDIDFTERDAKRNITVPVPPALRQAKSQEPLQSSSSLLIPVSNAAPQASGPTVYRSTPVADPARREQSHFLDLEDLQRAGLVPDFREDKELYLPDDDVPLGTKMQQYQRMAAVNGAPAGSTGGGAASGSLLTAALTTNGVSQLEAAFASFKPMSETKTKPVGGGAAPPLPPRTVAANDDDPFGDEYAVDPFK
ncbi:hypothetical protein HDU96_003479 [Phlyctochytrium bullatum]|nr:hypothetical protein HDU96_003479 [Phlyctochytrium bullatum]